MWKKFFITAIFISLLLCAGTIAANIYVDPYDVWSDNRLFGFNLCAYRNEDLERLTKPIKVNQLNPTVIFIGNSKTDFGLNPDSYITNEVYNLSLRNGQPHEILEFIKLACMNNNVRKIFLAIDFEMFADPREIMPGFDEDQLQSTRMTLHNFFLTTLSYDAVKDSIITVQKNSELKPHYRTIKLNGEYDDDFLQIIFNGENEFLATTRQLVVEGYKLERSGMYHKKLHDFEEICNLCHSKNIELQIFIPPVHTTHIEAYEIHRELYESWLKQIVQILSVPIIDFVSVNQITTDEKYFWNASHMKNSVGDMLLKNDPALESVMLSAENVDEHLQNLWSELENHRDDRMKYIGRFNADKPTVINSEQYTELINIDWITLDKNILSAHGSIDVPRNTIKESFIEIHTSNAVLYSKLINLDFNDESRYNFFTESILSGITSARCRIIAVDSSGTTLVSDFHDMEVKH